MNMIYVFPSDQDRADNDQLNEACEYIEYLLDREKQLCFVKNEAGNLVAVTRTDSDGEILEVLSESADNSATQPEPSSGVPEGWTVEAFEGGMTILWPGKRGGVHVKADDEHNSIAEDVLHDLAKALLTAALTPEAGQSGGVVAFGSGDKTVEVGAYDGRPAVFVAPAEPSGTPGELAPPTTGDDKHRLVPGEWLMTFPTEEQAFKVADALCGRPLKKLDGTTTTSSRR